MLAGPKLKGNNLILFNEFQNLYDFKLEDGKHLSAVLDYYATTMIMTRLIGVALIPPPHPTTLMNPRITL